MRIAILTIEEFAFNKYGGFGFVAREVANLFKERGHFVYIIDTSISPNGKTELSVNNIPVFFLRKRPGLFEKVISFFRILLRLKKIKPDALLCISEQVLEHCFFVKLCFPSLKTILWLQDLRTDKDWQKIFQLKEEKKVITGGNERIFWFKWKIKRFLKKLTLPLIDEVIAQADFLHNKFREIYKTSKVKIKTIYNPIYLPEEQKITKSPFPQIVFLGRLDPIKRPWVFAKLAEFFPEMEFIFIGKSHFPEIVNPKMKKFYNLPNLKFAGFLDGERKYEILGKSWILVNTSIYESLPVSFLEALAFKMAILSCHNPDNIVSRFGYFVGEKKEDENLLTEFCKGLKYLLEDNRWKKLGEEGYQFVKTHMNPEIICWQLLDILNDQDNK